MKLGLDFYVIYDHPDDYPNHIVLRRQTVIEGRIEYGLPSIHASLESARASVPLGLVRLPRSPEDVPCLVESWL